MKLLQNIARIIVGIIFIYSGFAKGVDPQGSMIKLIDYFNAFGMGWLNPTSLYLAIILSSTEFLIGVCLFLKLKIKEISCITFIVLSFFTLLTLILAIKNPVSDCGCFGDAIILSNWETFGKNMILLLLSSIIFIRKERYKSNWAVIDQYFWITATIIFIVITSIHSYKHLPLLDFRPYSVGSNIPEQMSVPANAELDEYKSIFKYKNKKTGEVKEFDETNYPWKDSLTWEYVEIRQELIKEGYHPPVHDFNIEHPYNGNISEEVLNDEGYTFLLISYNLSKASVKNNDQINNLYSFCVNNGYKFYCITASLDEEIRTFSEKNNSSYDYYNMDETQLKTIIRSNPGLILLRKGTIIGKWHNNDIPKIEDLKNKELSSFCIQQQTKKIENYSIIILILAWMSSLYFYIMRKYKKRLK